MSFRPGLLPLIRACGTRTAAPAAPAARGFHYLSQQPGASVAPRVLRAQQSQVLSIARALPRSRTGGASSSGTGVRAALALGLGLSALSLSSAQLDAPSAPAPGQNPDVIVVEHAPVDEPPQSMISVPQLTFGATCGICAGVFVKKGFKVVAFFLGGIFVLLQYLSSKRWVTVDWQKVSRSYDGAIATVDAQGKVIYPTPQSVVNGLVDFLTANFQQRATFVAGFILGLRLG